MKHKRKFIGLARIALALTFAVTASARAGSLLGTETRPPEESALAGWWGGRYATGNWFGARDALENRGVDFRANWRSNFLAIVDGGLEQRGGFDQEINFDLGVDLAKLLGTPLLEGLSFTGNIRYREADDSINPFSGTDGTFRPSAHTGGVGWRLRKAYFTWESRQKTGSTPLLTLSAGYQVPTDLFLVQPDSKLFTNQTIRTAKGINPNLPWGGSFSTWGGYAKLAPAGPFYVQSGLYLAYVPTGPVTLFYQPEHRDASQDALYGLTEIGVTPEIGPGSLSGKYALGAIFFGGERPGFVNGQTYEGSWQFYLQADQRLTREKGLAAGGKPDDQGLYWFSAITFAPESSNAMPAYGLGGLVYKGLIPGRDKDQAGVAFAYGSFSGDAAERDRARGIAPQDYQSVVEVDYRIQINRFAYVQPVFQYIFNPGGRGEVKDNAIVGLHVGVNF